MVEIRALSSRCGGPADAVDHDQGDRLTGTRPRGGEFRLPHLDHRLEQRATDQWVVLGGDAVAGVPGAEIGEERGDRGQVAQ